MATNRKKADASLPVVRQEPPQQQANHAEPYSRNPT